MKIRWNFLTAGHLAYLRPCPAAGHLATSRFVVKNSCSANYRCMTHDIYFVKTRTNKQKQTDVLLYVNDGCGLNNCYSIKCNKQQEKYLCFKGKDMYFRRRQTVNYSTTLTIGLLWLVLNDDLVKIQLFVSFCVIKKMLLRIGPHDQWIYLFCGFMNTLSWKLKYISTRITLQ